MWRPLHIAALVLLAAVLGGAWLIQQGVERFEGPGPLRAEQIVLIPKGSALSGIATRLAEAGVISEPLLFRIAVRAYGAAPKLRAGEYAFPAGASMRDVMDKLERGDTLVRRLTIPEGLTSREVAALLEQAEGLTGSVTKVPEEGSLLPETYHYSYGDSREDLVARMSQALDETLESLWQSRAGDLPLDSPREALILASIVEKETGVPQERPLVASVFVNRLRKGMRLQSDPTVAYGLTLGGAPLDRPLTRKDLAQSNPYNTYVIEGLPPGPIAAAGRAALEAVLAPADSEFLYFVADGSGGHAFARSLEEHNRNVASWRRIQKRRANGTE